MEKEIPNGREVANEKGLEIKGNRKGKGASIGVASACTGFSTHSQAHWKYCKWPIVSSQVTHAFKKQHHALFGMEIFFSPKPRGLH